VEYHDSEWGIPRFDDQYLYEMLLLESFQAGLSWECVLNKRENFAKAYDGFDIYKVISYDESKIEELLQNKGIIRNRRKICASIRNSRIFLEIREEYGSFHNYLRGFTKDTFIYETDKTTNALLDEISKDLQKRGMTFVGSVIIYSYLQAIGVICSHDKECYLYQGEDSLMVSDPRNANTHEKLHRLDSSDHSA
jgi:DNA-3-methyladenine glycosylase I